jgi:glycosyltransferase involved in cell wall biosynthesis
MKITIITPAFNSATTIRDTLQSIDCQDYTKVEHLVMDGGSKDDTLKICAEFPKVQVHSSPDKGLYDAMNKGLALATGDIVGILNSDDFYAHHSVLKQVAAQFEQTNSDALYGDLQYIDAQETQKILRHWCAGTYHTNRFPMGWMPPHPTFFVRRSVYERYGLFNTNLRFSADYELMLRFIHRYKISVSYLPEVLVKMRAGGVSNASFSNRWKANQEDRLAWRMNGLHPRWYTLLWKPLSKIGQFIP